MLALAALALGACAPEPIAPAAPGEALTLPEHYAHSIAALGFPGARRAFQVGHGSVVSGGDAAIEWTLGPAGAADSTSPVYFERDGVPIAHWWMSTADVAVHFEAAAITVGALGDTSVLLAVRATATRRTPGPVTLVARLRTRPAPPADIPWDAEDASRFEESWRERLAIRNGRVVAGMDPDAKLVVDGAAPGQPASTQGWGPGALVATCTATLAAGASKSWEFWMPAYPLASGPGQEPLAREIERQATFANVSNTARTEWREWLGKAAPLTTPDLLVNAAYRAALVTLILCQERDSAEWVPIGNPFQYRDTWLRDAARQVRALAVAGLTDLARSDALTLTRFQLPIGVLISQRGQLDGTGEALWAFEQATSMPPSPEWARRFTGTAQPAFRWLERMRHLSRGMQLHPGGVLPHGDPRDNELVRAQLVGNDAWGVAGERAVARLAQRAGDDTLARAASAAAEDYRGAFLEALDDPRTRSAGAGGIPPSWQGVGRDWGNLAVGYPTCVLPADDARLAATAARVWARAGGPGRLFTHAGGDSLHTYVGADLAQWALLADRPEPAQTYLRDVLAHSSSTLGQAELFARDGGGFGLNLPPHTTAAAAIVDLVRNMLVNDVRDTLEIASGAPASWWTKTSFARAPTRFGVIDVTLERPAPDRLHAHWTPVTVPTRVRAPQGERIIEVATAGATLVGDHWIELPAGQGEVEFRTAPATTRGRP